MGTGEAPVIGLLDPFIVIIAYITAFRLRFPGEIPGRNLDAFFSLLPAIFILHLLAGIASSTTPSPRRLARAHGMAFLGTLSAAYIFRDYAGALPTTVLFISLFISLPLLLVPRRLLLGAGPGRIKRAYLMGDDVDPEVTRARIGAREIIPVESIDGPWMETAGPGDALILGFSIDDPDEVLSIIHAAEGRGMIVISPPETAPRSEAVRLIPFPDRPLMECRPWEPPPLDAFMKRAFDILLGLIMLLVSAPLFPLIALIVRLSSPGPILYRQVRLGLHGRPFSLIKFRTMPAGIEADTGPVLGGEDDRRPFPAGRILRYLGLDELPQVFHVLSGRMSIVGPRPERPFFAGRSRTMTGRRLLVRPGITGLAQVRLPKDAPAQEKLRYDLWAMRHWSFLLDLQVVTETGIKLLSRLRGLIPRGLPSVRQDGSMR